MRSDRKDLVVAAMERLSRCVDVEDAGDLVLDLQNDLYLLADDYRDRALDCPSHSVARDNWEDRAGNAMAAAEEIGFVKRDIASGRFTRDDLLTPEGMDLLCGEIESVVLGSYSRAGDGA